MEDLHFIFNYHGREIQTDIKLFPLPHHQIRVEVNVTPGKFDQPEMYNFYLEDDALFFHCLSPEERHAKQKELAIQLEVYFTKRPL